MAKFVVVGKAEPTKGHDLVPLLCSRRNLTIRPSRHRNFGSLCPLGFEAEDGCQNFVRLSFIRYIFPGRPADVARRGVRAGRD